MTMEVIGDKINLKCQYEFYEGRKAYTCGEKAVAICNKIPLCREHAEHIMNNKRVEYKSHGNNISRGQIERLIDARGN